MSGTGTQELPSLNRRGRRPPSPSVIEVLAFLGPISLLTAALYYFGYASARAFYTYFGVSLSVLDFSTTNYLVRSADTFFRQAATVLLLLLVLFVAHHVLGQRLDLVGKRWARGLAFSLGLVGVATGVVGLLGLYGWPEGITAPISLGVSALLLEYSVWIAARHAGLPPRAGALMAAGVGLRRGLIAALVVVALFWAITDLATAGGRAAARAVEQSLPLQSQAVVYSIRDLHLPGAEVDNMDGDDNDYRYRYSGLRPLIYANGRWFLLPVNWTRESGLSVIVIEDDPGRIRVDLAPSSP